MRISVLFIIVLRIVTVLSRVLVSGDNSIAHRWFQLLRPPAVSVVTYVKEFRCKGDIATGLVQNIVKIKFSRFIA